MPEKPRKTKIRKGPPSGITETDYLYFSFGDFFEAENYTDGKSEEQLRDFWVRHQKAIMARYLEENRARGKGWAGTRPWAFWKYSMPEPQMPAPSGENSMRVWDHQANEYRHVETDYQFLQRLNLLEPLEIDS